MKRTALLALAAVSALSAPALAPTPAAAQYGPDTCRQGFVWREAFPGDHVCVRSWVRSETRMDNATAPDRMRQWICLAGIVSGRPCLCAARDAGARSARQLPGRLSPRLLTRKRSGGQSVSTL